jgi:stage IV sporulation protein B
MKEVQASIVEEQTVLAGGETAGIYVKTDGVLVIGTGVVQSMTGEEREPAENLVKSGDYITKINGQPIEEKEQLVEYLNENGKEDIVLTLRRDGEELEVTITPVLCEDKSYKIGVWIRDDIAGIGTIAYVTQENEYGILGHPISDVDTGTVVEMESGTLYEANILAVESGKIGTPGEIIGSITYNAEHELGTVENNTQTGVFGTVDTSAWEQFSANQTDWYPAAFKQEIELGSAQMISDVSGERKAYEVEILSLDYSQQHANKGILLQITDEELLNSTGGIVQGMSGSPLIQNGKIIGAVTHVFVNDPTKGYGVFIENMLEQM